jgi:protein O-mannosyl-transferase
VNPPPPVASLGTRWLALFLVLLGVIAYLPLKDAGWIWDDDSYVTKNSVLVDPDGLARIWTPGGTPQFYPLVFMSFWLEARLYGEDFVAKPFGFHLVNWVLHLGSAFLLWRILALLRVPGAWLAAALFLVHPMQVESVAWVTERKNVLAVFLALASLRAWLAFRDAKKGERAGWYLSALLLFAAAMLAKTMVAVLAPTLIALHVWRRSRWTQGDVTAIVPFFLVGVPLGLLTAWLERSWVGASGEELGLTVLDRVVLAPRSALWYVWTWLSPSNIAFIYERWDVNWSDVWQWIPAAIAVAALAGLAVLWRNGQRGPLVLAAIYVGAVFPALGFLDVYPFLFSYVADHFAYVGTLALATASGVVLARVGARVSSKVAWGATAVLSLGLAAVSAGHVTAYESEETLWRRTLATNPNAWMPASNLAGIIVVRAGAAAASGDLAAASPLAKEGESLARRATELYPEGFAPWVKLSESLRLQGRYDEAILAVREAIARNPGVPDNHWMLGRLLELTGRRDEAVEAYRQGATMPEAVRQELVDVKQTKTRRSEFARLLALLGRNEEAAAAWGKVAELDPADPVPLGNAGLARERAGQLDLAADAFKAAIARADPALRPADNQLVMQLMPRLVNALLSKPTSPTDTADALDASRWLVERTGERDPLALLFLARAERANGLATARATFERAQRLAADPLLPQELRAEIGRFANEFGAPPVGP